MSTLSLRKIKHDSSAIDNIALDSSGNTGFGISTPGARVDISVPSGINARLTKTSGAYLEYHDGTVARASISGLASADGLSINTGTAHTERVRIDASGRVTMPYQPAFSAGFDNNSGYTTFTGTMLWNTIISNVGSHYNSSNGRFTAPVAGNYFFAWNCLTADNSLYVELNLNKNGSVIVRTQQDGGNNQIGGQILIPLAVGDYVTIVATSNGTSTVYIGGSGVTYNQFSGFLVG